MYWPVFDTTLCRGGRVVTCPLQNDLQTHREHHSLKEALWHNRLVYTQNEVGSVSAVSTSFLNELDVVPLCQSIIITCICHIA